MNNRIIITLCICFIKLTIQVTSIDTPVVRTTKGPVQGDVLQTAINNISYSSFKGVPYAEPPLGYLRYKSPVEKKPWTDTLSAKIEGANCVQKDFVYQRFTGSEDCLYLNVYSPKLTFEGGENDLLSVMVWIYGGTFKSGYGNSSLYGPDYIIENGVVLVTFNYRLGPLGFLNLDHDNATGNAALKDQNLVLRWVRDNIEKFGGNPKDVTLFGQSAGGVAVDLHMLSELSKGLFHKAISMSASPLCPWAFQVPNKAVKNGFTLGRKLGIHTKDPDDLLKVLYETSAEEIMKKAEEMGSVFPAFRPTLERSIVALDEDKFLMQCPYEKYLTSKFNKVPYMTGFATKETLLFSGNVRKISETASFSASSLKLFGRRVRLPVTARVFQKLGRGAKSLSDSVINRVVKETSDLLFIAGIDYKRTMMLSRNGFPIYMYRFAYDSDESLHKKLYKIRAKGAAHGDDFGYLFRMTVSNQSMDPKNPSFITRQRMAKMWTNFAKYGNPTPDSNDALLQGITWPVSDKSNNYLEIDEQLVVKNNPVNGRALLVEASNKIILPFQTGCVSTYIAKVTKRRKMIRNRFSNMMRSVFRWVKRPFTG